MNAAVLAAIIATGPPAPATQDVPHHRAVALVHARVDDARRQRLVTNGIEVAVGVTQLGLGVYALTSVSDGAPGVRRLGIGQVLAGSVAVTVGGVFMFLPSSLEKLTKDPEYAALQRHPEDPVALRKFEKRWARRTDAARTLRLVAGSLTLAAGVGVSVWGGVSLGRDTPGRTAGEKVWALATVNSGLLLIASGVFGLVIRSPIERALLDYRSDGPARAFSVSVSPGLGGGTVALRF